jgi:hypothetical protein
MDLPADLPFQARATRAELEEMMRRWLEANRRAQRSGAWRTELGAHFTDDAEYHWDLGADEVFVARGRAAIEEHAIGYQMEGFEGWSYPYQRVVLDDHKGEVVAFWRQISPFKRPDGSFYEVPGLCGSHFVYGGNFKWSRQQDFFDLGCVIATLRDLAAAGHLSEPLKKKMHMLARGKVMPGHQKRAGRASALHKLRGNLALGRIALLGR